MEMVPTRGDSDVPAYDPMRQFSQLAGDVRDPYPMLADLRETTPVLRVGAEVLSAGRPADAKAPKLPPLFTVFPHEYVRQVLTDNMSFSSACHAMTMGHVMGRTILEMDSPEHQRHRALITAGLRLDPAAQDTHIHGLVFRSPPELPVLFDPGRS